MTRLKNKEPELDAIAQEEFAKLKGEPKTDHLKDTGLSDRRELVELIESIVDRKLQKFFEDVLDESLCPRAEPGQKGIDKTVKFFVSVPRSLYKHLKVLGGTVYAHITAAARLYLQVRK